MDLLKSFRERKKTKEKEKIEGQKSGQLRDSYDSVEGAKKWRAMEEEDSKRYTPRMREGEFYPCYYLINRSIDYGYIFDDKAGYTVVNVDKMSNNMDNFFNHLLADAEKNPDYLEYYTGDKMPVYTDIRHADGFVYAFCKFYGMGNVGTRNAFASLGVCFKEKDFEKLDVEGFLNGIKNEVKKVYLKEQSVFDLAAKYPVIFNSQTPHGMEDFNTKFHGQFDPFERRIEFDKAIKTKEGEPFLPEGDEWQSFVNAARDNKQTVVGKPQLVESKTEQNSMMCGK